MTKATIDTRFNPKFWTQEKPPEILVQQAKEQVLASFLEHAPPWEYIRVPRDVDHLDDLFEAASHIQSPEMAMLRVLKITAEQVDPRFYFGIPLEVQSFPTLFGPENQRGLTFAAGILEGGNSVEVFERKNLKGGLIAERYGFYSCVRLPHEVAPRVGFSHHYVSDVRAQLRKRQAFPTFEKLTQDDVWEILLYHLDPEASFVECGNEFISSLDDRKKAVSNYCEAHDFSESDIIRTLPILKRLGIHLQGEQILDRSILVSNTLFEDNAQTLRRVGLYYAQLDPTQTQTAIAKRMLPNNPDADYMDYWRLCRGGLLKSLVAKAVDTTSHLGKQKKDAVSIGITHANLLRASDPELDYEGKVSSLSKSRNLGKRIIRGLHDGGLYSEATLLRREDKQSNLRLLLELADRGRGPTVEAFVASGGSIRYIEDVHGGVNNASRLIGLEKDYEVCLNLIDQRTAVYDLLRNGPHRTASIAKISGISIHGVRDALRDLVDRGLITRGPSSHSWVAKIENGAVHNTILKHLQTQDSPNLASLQETLGFSYYSIRGHMIEFFEKETQRLGTSDLEEVTLELGITHKSLLSVFDHCATINLPIALKFPVKSELERGYLGETGLAKSTERIFGEVEDNLPVKYVDNRKVFSLVDLMFGLKPYVSLSFGEVSMLYDKVHPDCGLQDINDQITDLNQLGLIHWKMDSIADMVRGLGNGKRDEIIGLFGLERGPLLALLENPYVGPLERLSHVSGIKEEEQLKSLYLGTRETNPLAINSLVTLNGSKRTQILEASDIRLLDIYFGRRSLLKTSQIEIHGVEKGPEIVRSLRGRRRAYRRRMMGARRNLENAQQFFESEPLYSKLETN